MPTRNVDKIDVSDSYYHIYNRGHNRSQVFLDSQDYSVFINLLKRYLSADPQRDPFGVPYPHLYSKLELLCFCLMPNHFHLLIYQKDSGAMQGLMRGIMTSYGRYFNKKYRRSGPLFESRYKASLISDQTYLEHITRYIHLNPKNWRAHSYSSIDFYLGRRKVEWMMPQRIMSLFDNATEYGKFMEDYEANKQMLDELRYELANDITT